MTTKTRFTGLTLAEADAAELKAKRVGVRLSAWSKRADKARRKIDWCFRVADARRVFRYDGITSPRSEH